MLGMKVVVQRVKSASVTSGDETIAHIGPGVVLYVGIGVGDPRSKIDWLLESMAQETGELLVLSQFTLFGEFKGTKPSFHRAESNSTALEYFESVCLKMKQSFPGRVQTGVFGKHLDVYLELSGESGRVIEILEN